MKTEQSNALAAQLAAFLAVGGTITKLQPGSARGIKARKINPIN